jgi:error-prone DNA polymerase
VGKALGFDLAVVDAIAKDSSGSMGAASGRSVLQSWAWMRVLAVQQLITLTEQLIGPRHLSQHTGGLLRAACCAAWCLSKRVHGRPHGHRVGQGRPGRAGLLKVDVLALGMLSAIRRALDFIGQRRAARSRCRTSRRRIRPPTT